MTGTMNTHAWVIVSLFLLNNIIPVITVKIIAVTMNDILYFDRAFDIVLAWTPLKVVYVNIIHKANNIANIGFFNLLFI